MSDDTQTENLDGLIAQIRQEGMDEGQKQANEIIQQAHGEAHLIINQARAEAERMMVETEARVRHEERVARQALRRAARDVEIGLRSSLRQILEQLVRHECDDSFNSETLPPLILAVAEAWMQEGGVRPLEVHISAADRESLTNGFVGQLQERLRTGVELKMHPSLRRGFAISESAGNMQIEFTPEASVEALCACLNPRFSELFHELKTQPAGEP